jgi:hypothetical protein
MRDDIKGVIALFIDKEGNITAHAADFSKEVFSDGKLRDVQEYRAREKLFSEVIHTYCSPVIAQAIDRYRRAEIVRTMCNTHGAKLHFIDIGWE